MIGFLALADFETGVAVEIALVDLVLAVGDFFVLQADAALFDETAGLADGVG